MRHERRRFGNVDLSRTPTGDVILRQRNDGAELTLDRADLEAIAALLFEWGSDGRAGRPWPPRGRRKKPDDYDA